MRGLTHNHQLLISSLIEHIAYAHPHTEIVSCVTRPARPARAVSRRRQRPDSCLALPYLINFARHRGITVHRLGHARRP